MAGHQLKKLAQSRGKVGRSASLLEGIPKHWSVYSLLFSTAFVLLFCFLLFDIRTSPTALLLHATNQLGAMRAQAGELYSQSINNSPAEFVASPNLRKGTPHLAEDSDNVEDEDDNKKQKQKRRSLEKDMEEPSDRDGASGENVPITELLQIEDNDSESRQLSSDMNYDNTSEKPVERELKREKKEHPDRRPAEDPVTEENLLADDEAKVEDEKASIEEIRRRERREEEEKRKDITRDGLEKHHDKKKVEVGGADTTKTVPDSQKPHRESKPSTKQKEKSPPKTSGQDILKEVTIDVKCDYSVGQWVFDESYPLYKPDTCPFVDGGFRCVENGRPSDEFQKYRWQPSGCNLPRFNAKFMLEKLRGQRLAFVGDSIGRNNWESLLCMLSEAVTNKTRVYEINGEPITKHKGFLAFKFEDYNCTVEYYRSPYLVPQGRAPPNSPPEVHTTFKLDLIDWSATQWKDADILIFNSGHWWSYEKTIRGGNYFQVKDKLRMKMEVGDGFRMAMQTVAKYVDENVDPRKTQVFWRSYAPVHFRGGTWKTGGSCNNEQKPLLNLTKYEEPWVNKMIWEETQKNKRTPVTFLNITFASEHRADGHSSIWQRVPPSPINRQDCSHWCLPGVPDTWNEFLFAALLDRAQGPWGTS